MKLKLTISLVLIALIIPVASFASETNGTINSVNKYAWSNQAGWVNFKTTNGDIKISDSGITGYAWNSNYGWINMSPTNGGVKVAINGSLSGYAWGANLGWVNFSGVSINSSGKFTGSATGNVIGTLTFDCNNCNVSTDYRPKNFRAVTTTTQLPRVIHNGTLPVVSLTAKTVITQPKTITVTPPLPTQTRTAINPTNIPTRKVAINTTVPSNTKQQTNVQAKVLPEQLFDIRFLIDNSPAIKSENIVSRVTFISFGKVPTPIKMTFSIIDKNGKVVWKKDANTTVQTEAVYVKRLPALNLPVGKYTLNLHTKYNKTVEDNFKEPFQIISEGKEFNWLPWSIGILIILIFLILAIKLIRDRRISDPRM